MSAFRKRVKKSSATVRGIIVITVTLALLLGLGVPLWSQEIGGTSHFVEELSGLLEGRGWSEEEIGNLVGAAKELDWEGTEGADPEIVALALEFGKGEEGDMEPLEQAQLALELALAAVEMESLGYNERAVVRVALNGVRDILSDIQSWKEGGREGNLGEVIRNRLGNEVRSTDRVQVQELARERARERSGGVSESGFSQIPSRIISPGETETISPGETEYPPYKP